MFLYRSARYDVTVENPQRVSRGLSLVEIDGVRVAADLGVGLADGALAAVFLVDASSVVTPVIAACRTRMSVRPLRRSRAA
jgi:hypothetical protein